MLLVHTPLEATVATWVPVTECGEQAASHLAC